MEIDADETGARAAEPRTTAEVEPAAVAATISEEATSPAADAHQREESPTGDKARPSSPTPIPPHCLGARGYDEGFCDVGSFFVYQHEPRQQQQVVKDNGMMDLELFGAAPPPPTEQAPTHLLQYKLMDGLRIKYSPAVGGENEVEGHGLEVAGRTFLLLQRQVDSMRRALVSVADSRSPAMGSADTGENDEEEESDNNTDANANGGGGGGGAAAANGKRKQQRPHLAREEVFALSNTEDNESLQGLVRSRGSLWIGKFGLPSPPAGEDESELVDIWPQKVARFVEDGGGGAFPLEGKPNAFGSLAAPKEGSASRRGAVECARRAQGLIAQALGELRPHVPTPPKEEGEEVDNNPASSLHWSPSLKPDRGGKAGGSVVGSGGGSSGSPKAAAAASPGKVKPVPMSAGDSEEEDTEEEKPGATTGQGTAAAGGARGRRGRKRQRVEGEEVVEGGGGGAGASYRLRGRESSNGVEDMDDDSDDDDDERGAESRGGDAGGPTGAGEMTVAAVRESLLSNPSEEGEPGPSPQDWEVAVKKFISHVESLPPGTEQEELSLMFAAALDPTLVRLRMANTKLIGLAEACLPQGEGEVSDDDDGEDSDSPNGGGAGKGGAKKSGFKVRLELEAPEEGAPPPDGIAGVLRAVAAAAAAVEAAARAEACVICGGDTLGGLGEIKRDYKRCLPPGPREPLQFIIAEEEARVEGYVGAHRQVLRDAGETFRELGPEVGRAYRAVERETGWSGVRDQVDAFLIEFEDYCASLMPAPLSTSRSILGVDLAAARRAAAAAPAGGAAPAGSATKPVKAA
ncbi:unnamed protein product [Ectocarpus sp. 12 AP-2014]